MRVESIKKTGDIEELKKDLEKCGFYPDPECEEVARQVTMPLDAKLAVTRVRLDEAIREILEQSGLPLHLFDLLLDSIQSDIRKADADATRFQLAHSCAARAQAAGENGMPAEK